MNFNGRTPNSIETAVAWTYEILKDQKFVWGIDNPWTLLLHWQNIHYIVFK